MDSIFWTPDKYAKVTEMSLPLITEGTENRGVGTYLLRAGTPLSEDFAVANTSSAKYLAAEDYFFYAQKADQPKVVPIIERGYIDKASAEAAAGITYTDAAISALAEAGIIIVDGALEAGGGGDPGYDVETVTVDIIPEQTVTPTVDQGRKYAELTLAEGVTAAPDSLHVVLNGDEYDLTGEPAYGGVIYALEDESAGIYIGFNPGTGALVGSLSVSTTYPETVTVHATSAEEVVTVTDDFKDAVDFCTGYSITTDEEVIIPEQTVSVTPGESPYANLTLAEGVDAAPDSLTVVLDGVEHTTTVIDLGGDTVMYAADDESFDVVIGPTPGDTTFFAVIEGDLSGSITVEASTTEEVVTVSDGFKAAVAAASDSGGGDVFAVNFTFDGATEQWVCDKTYDEVESALSAGQNVIGFYTKASGELTHESYASVYAVLSEMGAGFYFRSADDSDGSGFMITFHGEYISRSDLPGSRLVVISSWSSDDGKYVLDQTWEDIADAYASGIPVYIHEFDSDGAEHGFFLVNGVRSIDTGGGVYAYVVVGFNPINSGDFGRNIISYTADIESGYPAGNYPLQ